MRSFIARLVGTSWKGSRSSVRSVAPRWNIRTEPTAVFTWMNSHRGHREHREIIKFPLCPLCALWLTVSITSENRYSVVSWKFSNPQLLRQQIQKRPHIGHHAQRLLRASVREFRHDRRVDVHADHPHPRRRHIARAYRMEH